MIAYAITSPQTLHFTTLKEDIERFAKHADMILYRDKENEAYAYDAKYFLDETDSYLFERVLLHQDIDLCCRVGAKGVHLSSRQIKEITRAKSVGLFVVVSTHTIEEALEAERLGADMVTLSPIFQSPNKGRPIGLPLLSKAVEALAIPIIALGGIVTPQEIEACEMVGAKGFASIRYFA